MEKVKLCELADIYLGVTHTPEYVFDGVPFLSVKDISSGKICFDDCKYISKEEYESLSEGAKPKVGDMLFCRVGTLGKPIIIPEGTPLFGSFVSLGYLRNKNADRCDLNYLRYWMYSNSFWKQVNSNVKGASQVNLNTGWLSKFDIDLPDMPEQKYRISVLDKCKVIIEQREEELKVLDDLIKARFVELFGDPVQNTKGWDTDICKNLTSKIGSGATPKGGRGSYGTEGISLIRSMNVYNNRFEYKDLAYITDEQADKLSNVIIEENDVLLNITGASVARCCVVPKELIPARVNQHVAIVRCKDRLLPEFLCSMFTEDSYQRLLWSIATSGGATREAITKQQIEDLVLIVPPIEFQQQFVEFCKQVDKSKFAD